MPSPTCHHHESLKTNLLLFSCQSRTELLVAKIRGIDQQFHEHVGHFAGFHECSPTTVITKPGIQTTNLPTYPCARGGEPFQLWNNQQHQSSNRNTYAHKWACLWGGMSLEWHPLHSNEQLGCEWPQQSIPYQVERPELGPWSVVDRWVQGYRVLREACSFFGHRWV